MLNVLTPAEMGDADRRTIAAGTSAEELMARAGRAVAWSVRQVLQGTYGRRAVIACGKGNNGGDGIVATEILRGWGIRTDVVPIDEGFDERRFRRALERADVAVDAMFGTGFRGELDAGGATVAQALTESSCPVVAVDIPSGVDGSTGEVRGHAISADVTVTFAALKPGLVIEPGRTFAGKVVVADIGIDLNLDGAVDGTRSSLHVVDAADAAACFGDRPVDANKWDAGLLVIGGSGGMTGAPGLVSRAALRSGAGIVWCAVPGRDAAMRGSGTEVIMKALPATDDGALAGFGTLLHSVDRFRAVVIGPGLGSAESTRTVVRDAVMEVPIPLVLDADGLNVFAGTPDALKARPAMTILTPHDGEYERLMGEPVGADRVDAARSLARATGCVALLKGPTTIVADPEGQAMINPTGGPQLATAGTGDVLSGIIGGLLAAGVDAFDAGSSGAYVHGLVADTAGHTGLIAGDLVEGLPRVLSELIVDSCPKPIRSEQET